MVVSRISYVLITIYVDLNQRFEPEFKEKIIFRSKSVLMVYAIANYVSRIVVAFFDHKSWLIKKSSDQTLAFLSIFYSVLSVALLGFLSLITYLAIKRTIKNSTGHKINKNLKIISFTLIFTILCFWISIICGHFLFIGNSKTK